MTTACVLDSPVGRIRVTEAHGAITDLSWTDGNNEPPATPVLRAAAKQLAAYFAGQLGAFALPLAPEGTDHQKKVWTAMTEIPSGTLRTYGDLAREIGSSARAVGTACGRNPIPIIVPCHRVVATGGGIGGYSGRGGVETKRKLLNLEGLNTDGPVLDGDLFNR